MLDVNQINLELDKLSAEQIVEWTLRTFRPDVILSSSFGEQSAVMLHMTTTQWSETPVVVTDTGYFFTKTYEFMEALRDRFHLNLYVYRALMSPLQMQLEFGELWETDMAKYNWMRKTEPMERALKELRPKVWITGRRANQTAERNALQIVEMREDGILKVNPILKWTDEDVWLYMMKHDLPYHPMVAEGYSSTGDWHSTFPGKGREGRFNGKGGECGLHTWVI